MGIPLHIFIYLVLPLLMNKKERNNVISRTLSHYKKGKSILQCTTYVGLGRVGTQTKNRVRRKRTFRSINCELFRSSHLCVTTSASDANAHLDLF